MEGSALATRAPSVVAVVVSGAARPYLAETLAALAAQDYDNLSVLVLVSADEREAAAEVAAVLPDAFVRRVPEGSTYARAVAEALEMVQGASFFLLCHDDVAPTPGAVHVMVEESFRSNAGIVSPKFVHWDRPDVLVHVGQNADKTGAVVERVLDGEIDAGQHDAVRDVFVAPGGCTLVRADLLRALGGLSTAVVGMGEDLDLSWRAHVAGARVVVAPEARVRHVEQLAAGRRAVPDDDAPSLQALQRRHELAAVLTCYSLPHLLRVLPQTLALALGEMLVAAFVGDHRRVRALLHAWRWNLGRTPEIRAARAQVRALRVLPDADVRSLQVRGSARLSTYVARLTHQGADVAHGIGEHARHGAGRAASALGPHHDGAPVRTGFAEDAEYDELDDFGRVARRPQGYGSSRWLATRRARLGAWALIALVLVLGSRNLLGAPLPLVSQFLPLPTWTGTWHQFVASWQPAGLGSATPADPAFGMLGLVGAVLGGRMGLLQEVLVLGCVPLGAWGASRLVRPFSSARACFAAAFAYLALPLPYDALARGRLDGLVAYAATPWLVAQIARATSLAPFGVHAHGHDGVPRWRRSLAGRVVVAGTIEAAAVAFAPATAVVVLVVGVGVVVGSVVVGGRARALRGLATAVGATLAAVVLLAPWAIATLASGRGALWVLGLPGSPRGEPGWGALLRMAVGPVGSSPLSWLVLAAAVAPLLIGRGARLGWATRLWSVALVAWLVALVSVKAWAGPFAPSPDVLLAPAAVGLAGAAGLGVAATETDLAGYRFGWRQAVAALSVAALALGAFPVLAEAVDGRWGVPASGYAGAASLARPRTAAGYEVLWLGDPRALPGRGWPIGPGLAYATSHGGTPDVGDLWGPASPGDAAHLAAAVRVAMDGETVDLGRALAREGVRYVVVVTALAPRTPGTQNAPTFPAPQGLVAALGRQRDLATVPESVGGLSVFENTVRAPRAGGALGAPGAAGWARVADPLGAAWELLAWCGVAAALLGRRRWLDWWWDALARRRARRTRRRAGTPAPVGVVPVAEEPALVGAGAGAGAEEPE